MSAFGRGFQALLPLWTGLIPFAMAYAVLARAAGLSLWETQSLSLFVFAGSSQFSAAGLFGVGASGLSIIFTTFLINLRHVLYTLTLGQRLKLSWRERLLAAHLTTDEAFGVTVAGEMSYGFFMGAALSLYSSWNLFTFVGALLSSLVPDPVRLGLDFIFPLAFLALLIPLLKTRNEWIVALFTGGAAFLGAFVINSGLNIFLVGVLGSLLGALLPPIGVST